MVEHGLVHLAPDAFEPDPEYLDDDFFRVAGLVTGNEFVRILRVPNLSGSGEFKTSITGQVMVAVIQDQNGISHFEAFDPDRHGEEFDLPMMNIADFKAELEDAGLPFSIRNFNNLRKQHGGASRPASGYVDGLVKDRGGDPEYRMQKTVFQRNKLR